jgi:hypothetical protein
VALRCIDQCSLHLLIDRISTLYSCSHPLVRRHADHANNKMKSVAKLPHLNLRHSENQVSRKCPLLSKYTCNIRELGLLEGGHIASSKSQRIRSLESGHSYSNIRELGLLRVWLHSLIQISRESNLSRVGFSKSKRIRSLESGNSYPNIRELGLLRVWLHSLIQISRESDLSREWAFPNLRESGLKKVATLI